MDAVKAHLRIPPGYTAEDDYLRSLRDVALAEVESKTGRKVLRQTWRLYLDNWPAGDSIEVPYPPLSTATAPVVTYVGSASTSYTLSSTKYRTDAVSEPGRVVLRYDGEWANETLDIMNAVRVQFQCGYQTSTVPARLKQAMLIRIGDLYENRESVAANVTLGTFAKNDIVDQLLAPFKVFHFGKEQE